jgi:hypothetical protein
MQIYCIILGHGGQSKHIGILGWTNRTMMTKLTEKSKSTQAEAPAIWMVAPTE